MIFYPYFENYMLLQKPPTLYALLNSKVNYSRPADDQIKIEELPSYGRNMIFNFDYELSDAITKEEFETDIITHFFERRIGFDTVLSFRMHFKNRLREILPVINPMFDALAELNLADSEVITRERTESGSREREETTSSTGTTSSSVSGTSGNTNTNKFSDTPQNQLSLVENDNYLTEYRKIIDNGTNSEQSSGTDTTSGSLSGNDSDSREESETITRDKVLENLTIWNERKMNVMNYVYNSLEELFYQLV